MTVWCERECTHSKEGKCARNNIIIGATDGVCQDCKAPNKIFVREDNTVVFDEAGIPSVMVRFIRPEDGSEDRLFTAGGVLYDELYISKYKNCMINGKSYSLPHMKPWTNINLDEAEKVCFEKGEGWHLMTAAEHGFLARMALKNGTLPHGNTDKGKYHENHAEKCELYNGYQMFTGTGPETWYHDHTIFGVDGLCGDTWEWMRGLRLMDGQLQSVPNNEAAMPIDLSRDSENWKPITTNVNGGEFPVYMYCDEDGLIVSTDWDDGGTDGGSTWSELAYDCPEPPDMYRLGLFQGDMTNYIYVDPDGERLPLCGGAWLSTGSAGVFYGRLLYARTYSSGNLGFRSAYLRKL